MDLCGLSQNYLNCWQNQQGPKVIGGICKELLSHEVPVQMHQKFNIIDYGDKIFLFLSLVMFYDCFVVCMAWISCNVYTLLNLALYQYFFIIIKLIGRCIYIAEISNIKWCKRVTID